MQSEAIMNLYVNYLIQHKESITQNEFENVISQILYNNDQIHEKEEKEKLCFENNNDSEEDLMEYSKIRKIK